MRGAAEYSEALFSLCEELGTTDAALADCEICAEVLKNNPSYMNLCDTPAVSIDEKQRLIAEAFAKIDESVRNLIMILAEHHSVHLFPAIAKELHKLYCDSRGICEATAVSAYPLTERQLDAIKAKLERMTGKSVVIKNEIDKSVISGVTLRYMGVQLDGSLKSRLAQIERSLKNTIL